MKAPPTPSSRSSSIIIPHDHAAMSVMDGHPTVQRTPVSTDRSRALNCGECRRLKSECKRVFNCAKSNADILFALDDREWPCSECLRRGTSHICPTGILHHDIFKRRQISHLEGRIAQLEVLLNNNLRRWRREHL